MDQQQVVERIREMQELNLHRQLRQSAAVNCYGSYTLLYELLPPARYKISAMTTQQRQTLEQLAGPHGRTVCRTLAIQKGIDLSTYQKGEPVRYTANTDGD